MVRLRVHLHAEDGEISWIDWLRPGRGLLYNWLDKINPELNRVLHDSKRIAPFGYGRLTFPDARRRDDVHPVGGDGWWDIGTIHPKVAQAWATVLSDRPIISWAGTPLAVTRIEQVPLPADLAAGSAVLTTATPVVVRGRGSIPLMPPGPGYERALTSAVRYRAAEACRRPDQVNVRVLWSGEPETVPISATRHDGDLPQLSGCPVKVHVFGPPAALEALWCCGIGQMSTAGFGWVQHPGDTADKPALDRDLLASLCAKVHPSRAEALRAAAVLSGQGWRVQTTIRPEPRPDGTLLVAAVYDPLTPGLVGELRAHLRPRPAP
jgi:CRISPR-associated endoribonuclease Cas6